MGRHAAIAGPANLHASDLLGKRFKQLFWVAQFGDLLALPLSVEPTPFAAALCHALCPRHCLLLSPRLLCFVLRVGAPCICSGERRSCSQRDVIVRAGVAGLRLHQTVHTHTKVTACHLVTARAVAESPTPYPLPTHTHTYTHARAHIRGIGERQTDALRGCGCGCGCSSVPSAQHPRPSHRTRCAQGP